MKILLERAGEGEKVMKKPQKKKKSLGEEVFDRALANSQKQIKNKDTGTKKITGEKFSLALSDEKTLTLKKNGISSKKNNVKRNADFPVDNAAGIGRGLKRGASIKKQNVRSTEMGNRTQDRLRGRSNVKSDILAQRSSSKNSVKILNGVRGANVDSNNKTPIEDVVLNHSQNKRSSFRVDVEKMKKTTKEKHPVGRERINESKKIVPQKKRQSDAKEAIAKISTTKTKSDSLQRKALLAKSDVAPTVVQGEKEVLTKKSEIHKQAHETAKVVAETPVVKSGRFSGAMALGRKLVSQALDSKEKTASAKPLDSSTQKGEQKELATDKTLVDKKSTLLPKERITEEYSRVGEFAKNKSSKHSAKKGYGKRGLVRSERNIPKTGIVAQPQNQTQIVKQVADTSVKGNEIDINISESSNVDLEESSDVKSDILLTKADVSKDASKGGKVNIFKSIVDQIVNLKNGNSNIHSADVSKKNSAGNVGAKFSIKGNIPGDDSRAESFQNASMHGTNTKIIIGEGDERISIMIRMVEQQVSVDIRGVNADALNELQKSTEELESALEEKGLSLTDFSTSRDTDENKEDTNESSEQMGEIGSLENDDGVKRRRGVRAIA